LRELADCDPARIEALEDWPLRDLFLAYVERMKQAAREAYSHDVLIWTVLAAAGAKIKKPDVPGILQGPKIIVGGR
jgi:hypothetical protein